MCLARDGLRSEREWANSNPVTGCWPSACAQTIRLSEWVPELRGLWTGLDHFFNLLLTIFPKVLQEIKAYVPRRDANSELLWVGCRTRGLTPARSNPTVGSGT